METLPDHAIRLEFKEETTKLFSVPVIEPPEIKSKRSLPFARKMPSRRWLKRLLIFLSITIFIPLFTAFLYLHYFGLPEQFKQKLLVEMRRRGLIVNVDRLFLDYTGGVLAKHLTVYPNVNQQRNWFQVDEVHISFGWLSWWRGKPLLENAVVRNAQMLLPIGTTEMVELHDVNVEVNFTEKGLEIVNADLRIFNLQFFIQGNIHLETMPSSRPITPENLAQREKIWRIIKSYAKDATSDQPIQLLVNIDFSMAHPETAVAQLALLCRDAQWRDVPITEVACNAHLKDGLATLDDFHIRLLRGEFSMHGESVLADQHGEIQVNSNLDFTPVAAAFPGRWQQVIGQLDFSRLPLLSGRCLFNWNGPFTYDLQADLDWRDFSYNRIPIDLFTISAAFDGNRLLIPQIKMENISGGLNLDFFYDKTKPEIKGKIHSDLDLTLFQGIFGEGMDRFLASCFFPKKGPAIDATITGTDFKSGDIFAQGKLALDEFSYKDISFKSANADFTFNDFKLKLPNLQVKRDQGANGIGAINGGLTYDFKNRTAQFDNFTSTMQVQEVAPVLGGKFPGYVRPYRFSQPPSLKVNGLVDLQSQNPKLSTDLTIDIDSHATMEWELMKVNFAFKNPQARLRMVDRQMTVVLNQSELFQGKFQGILNMDLSQPSPSYQTKLNLVGVNFNELMKSAFNYQNVTGTFKGQATLNGVLGQMESINGSGEVSISDGYLASIPFLGGLSSLLSNIIPSFGYAKMSQAHANFTVANGVIDSKNIEANSTAFIMVGDGKYQFLAKNLDLNLRVNVRGIVGILLFPVSKLFEYKGVGPLDNVKWSPTNF